MWSRRLEMDSIVNFLDEKYNARRCRRQLIFDLDTHKPASMRERGSSKSLSASTMKLRRFAA